MVYSEDRSTQKDTSSSAGASSLSDLIARLEKATGPDRELDAEIFRAIGTPLPEQFLTAKLALEWNEAEKCFTFDFADTRIRYEQPCYTKSIDAAMTLVPGYHKYILGSEWCAVWQEDGRYNGSERVPTRNRPAIALCIAALKAQLSTRTNEQDDARNLSGVSSE